MAKKKASKKHPVGKMCPHCHVHHKTRETASKAAHR